MKNYKLCRYLLVFVTLTLCIYNAEANFIAILELDHPMPDGSNKQFSIVKYHDPHREVIGQTNEFQRISVQIEGDVLPTTGTKPNPKQVSSTFGGVTKWLDMGEDGYLERLRGTNIIDTEPSPLAWGITSLDDNSIQDELLRRHSIYGDRWLSNVLNLNENEVQEFRKNHKFNQKTVDEFNKTHRLVEGHKIGISGDIIHIVGIFKINPFKQCTKSTCVLS
ncbi:MAG TPA: hypothetical protein VKR58_05340 [Aquella sp.]|nr:hypothetical protein [Aquella sp.]